MDKTAYLGDVNQALSRMRCGIPCDQPPSPPITRSKCLCNMERCFAVQPSNEEELPYDDTYDYNFFATPSTCAALADIPPII